MIGYKRDIKKTLVKYLREGNSYLFSVKLEIKNINQTLYSNDDNGLLGNFLVGIMKLIVYFVYSVYFVTILPLKSLYGKYKWLKTVRKVKRLGFNKFYNMYIKHEIDLH